MFRKRVTAKAWPAAAVLVAACLVLHQQVSHTAAQATSQCKQYHPTDTPVQGTGPLLSVVAVTDAFQVASVAVQGLDLNVPRLSPIKISLSAGVPGSTTPVTVIVKDVKAGGNATALQGVSFADDSQIPLPLQSNGSIVGGVYEPTQALASLTAASGGAANASAASSQRVWVLRVVNLADDAATEPAMTLNNWVLELCSTSPAVASAAAGPSQQSAPSIEASAGPPAASAPAPTSTASEPSVTVTTSPATAPATATTITTGPAVAATNVTSNGTTTAHKGVLEELLDRLNNVSLSTGLASGNRTALLRSAILGNENDTVLQRLSNRIDNLISTINDTRLIQTLNNASASTTGSSPSLYGSRFRLANPATTTTTLSSTNTQGNTSALLDQFINAFKNLVSLAAGSNITANGLNATSLMAQSAIGLDNDTLALIPQLLRGAQNGQLYHVLSFGNGSTIAGLAQMYQSFLSQASSMNSPPPPASTFVTGLLKAANASAYSSTSSLFPTLKAVENWLQSSSDLGQQATAYKSMLSSGSGIVSALMQRAAQQSAATTTPVLTALKNAISDVSTMSSSTTRDSVLQSLQQALQNAESAATQQTSLLGTQLPQAVQQFFKSYSNLLTSGLGSSALTDLAGETASGSSGVSQLTSALQRLNNALSQYKSSTGSLANVNLSKYAPGLQWLEKQLSSLKSSSILPALSAWRTALSSSSTSDASNTLAQKLLTLSQSIQKYSTLLKSLRNQQTTSG